MYGIVASGELIHLNKLTSNGEVLSLPVFLPDGEGLPPIWSSLRSIIHAIQIKVPPPADPEKCIMRQTRDFRVARMPLNHKWGLNSDGRPYEQPDDSPKAITNARLRRQYVERLPLLSPGNAECDRIICEESELEEDGLGCERPCPHPDLKESVQDVGYRSDLTMMAMLQARKRGMSCCDAILRTHNTTWDY